MPASAASTLPEASVGPPVVQCEEGGLTGFEVVTLLLRSNALHALKIVAGRVFGNSMLV